MLNHILIKTKRQVFSEHLGNNLSPKKGEGYDFLELREYEEGEDIKKIDWISSAKLQKPYIKIYHDVKELNIIISCMLNGSLFFGTSKLKQEIMAEVSSILGYSSIKQNDPFSSFIFSSTNIQYTKPTKKIFSVSNMVSNILNFNPIGYKNDYKYMADKLYHQIKKKSLLFIIGDFLDEFDFKLLSAKHEVIVIIIRDKFEENPDLFIDINMVDPSNNSKFNMNLNKSTIKSYKLKIVQNDKKMIKHFKDNNIKWCKIYTNEEPVIKLKKLFL